MIFSIFPRIGRIIRTTVTRPWHHQPPASTGNSSPSASQERSRVDIELQETEETSFIFGVELQEPYEVNLQANLKEDGYFFCQAIQESTGSFVLFANLKEVDPINLATKFKLQPVPGPGGDTNFCLKNQSIQGYIALTDDNSAFTIVPDLRQCCIFTQQGTQQGGVLQVLNTPPKKGKKDDIFVMVKREPKNDKEDKRLVVTSDSKQATVFNPLIP